MALEMLEVISQSNFNILFYFLNLKKYDIMLRYRGFVSKVIACVRGKFLCKKTKN